MIRSYGKYFSVARESGDNFFSSFVWLQEHFEVEKLSTKKVKILQGVLTGEGYWVSSPSTVPCQIGGDAGLFHSNSNIGFHKIETTSLVFQNAAGGGLVVKKSGQHT
jgi:hypothetical protein